MLQVVEQNGLSESKSQFILEGFQEYFTQAAEWETKAKSIQVTSKNDTKQMFQAKEARMALKRIRVDSEHKRKELKEQSLREGKAIDGVANIIKALVVPIEEHLEKKEKFVALLEAKEKEELAQKREEELEKYEIETEHYDLVNMSQIGFTQLLSSSRKVYEEKIADEKRLEAERVAKEKTEAEENKRIAKENEQLKKEAEKREKEAQAERKKAEIERRKLEEIARIETEKNAKIEAEVKAKKEEDTRKQLEIERKAKEELEAKQETERQLKLQPDKEKINVFADLLEHTELPQVKSAEAKKVISDANELLMKVSKYLRDKSKSI